MFDESKLSDVEKAARKSILSHLQDLHKAASDHAAAAKSHADRVQGSVGKVMKLAGFTNDPEEEGGQKGVHVPEVDTTVKSSFVLLGKTADGVEIYKKVDAAPAAPAVQKTAEEIAEKAARKAGKKATKAAFRIAVLKMAGLPIPAELAEVASKMAAASATDPNKSASITGNRKDVVKTGTPEKKDHAARKAAEEKNMTLAKAGFAGDGEALNELYDSVVTRTPIKTGVATA